jgi:hypothetical protein
LTEAAVPGVPRYVDLYCPWCWVPVAEDDGHRAVAATKLHPYVVWARGPGELPRDDADLATPFYRYACPAKGCDYVEVHSHRLVVARGA